jgi:hypothetical protein
LTTATGWHPLLVHDLVLELQAPIRQLAEAEAEIFVDRAGEDEWP